MDEAFLNQLYQATEDFENWRSKHKYDSFDEAEEQYFNFIEKANAKGMNYVDRGGDRDVYTGGSIAGDENVVKIARESLIQNQHAIETWKEIPEEAKMYIAPIKNWSDGYEWLVQARASGRGNVEEVAENLAKYDLHVSDLNGQNVARYDGRSVLIDLGQLH